MTNKVGKIQPIAKGLGALIVILLVINISFLLQSCDRESQRGQESQQEQQPVSKEDNIRDAYDRGITEMNARIAEIIRNDPGWESKPDDDKITQIVEDQDLALIATQACDEMLRLRSTPATAQNLSLKLAKCVAVERVKGEECRFLEGFLAGCPLRTDTAAPAQPLARTLEEQVGLNLVAFYSVIEDLLLAVLPDIKDRLGVHLPDTLDRSTLDSISVTEEQARAIIDEAMDRAGHARIQNLQDIVRNIVLATVGAFKMRQEEKGECPIDTPGIERKSGRMNDVRHFAYAMYECAEAQESSESPSLCKFTRPSKEKLNQVMSKLLSELSGVQGHWKFTIRNWSK